jgi:hypothetical protein
MSADGSGRVRVIGTGGNGGSAAGKTVGAVAVGFALAVGVFGLGGTGCETAGGQGFMTVSVDDDGNAAPAGPGGPGAPNATKPGRPAVGKPAAEPKASAARAEEIRRLAKETREQRAARLAAERAARAADLAGEHTLRLKALSGLGHAETARREAEILNTKFVPRLKRATPPEAFTVSQGDETLLCFGRYPPPRELPGGRLEFPADVNADRDALLAYAAKGAVGGIKPILVKTPAPSPANPFRLSAAKGEWTLHCMSFMGDPDSKLTAIEVARYIREQYGFPTFLLKDGGQSLVLVGDLPADALKIEDVGKPQGPAAPKANTRGAVLMESLRRPDLRATPLLPEAKEIWQEFRVFSVNGQGQYLPKEMWGKDGRPIAVDSRWLRIPQLRNPDGTVISGDADGLTEEERLFLGGGR